LAVLAVVVAAILFAAGLAWRPHRLGLWLTAASVVVVGLALIVVSLVAWRRRRVYVELEPDGYAIYDPAGERTGAWSDVTRVALSRRRDKLALYHGESRRTIIAHPAGRADDDFLRLCHDIDRHLDAAG
jgi:Na+/melibiose symporter-like transporter